MFCSTPYHSAHGYRNILSAAKGDCWRHWWQEKELEDLQEIRESPPEVAEAGG